MDKAKMLLKALTKKKGGLDLIEDKNYIFSKKSCQMYKKIRFENKTYFTKDSSIPLAYSILVYNNVEQFERLFNLIYKPSNIYCIHVDLKSSEIVKNAIRSIADCFDNVFVVTQMEYIIYAGFSRLKADINCMSDLLNLTNLINKHENLIGKRDIKWK